MKYLFHVLIFIWIFFRVNGGLFDRSNGKKVDEALAKELRSKNAIDTCAIEVNLCTPHEGSRVDGTCNNFKYPSRGAARGPYIRIFTRDHGNSSGSERALPSARRVRTALQATGRVQDKNAFTTAAVHFLEFIAKDVSAMSGPVDSLKRGEDCCKPGNTNKRCFPIPVPQDDPYLRVTDIRCLNFTRAETFQDLGCVPSKAPEPVNFQTPIIDLSTIYGVDDKALDSVREFRDGLLKLEKRKGRLVPLDLSKSYNVSKAQETNGTVKADNVTDKGVCIQNNGNNSVCYRFGFPETGNTDLRTTTLAILFMREHNRLAEELYKINPCWKDDRLFKVARQINIATASNIFLYELLPLLMGINNMFNIGLISDRVEYVTTYDQEQVPLLYAEYEVAMSYFHTMLDGRIKRYDEQYHYTGELPLGATLFKQGLIEEDKVFEEINRGTFYQNAARIDDIQDPEISENFYGELQRAQDLAAMDIQRGRDLGVGGYNDYRHHCGLKRAKNFDEFLDLIEEEKVAALKNLYTDVDDVDLLAGIMAENPVKGTYTGNTLFCIMAKQLKLFRLADRFWFERGDQFHSLSFAQLHEVRRTNIARLACDNAEGIDAIQPQAFMSTGYENRHMPCRHIPGPDLTKWQDPNCRENQERNKEYKYKYQWESKVKDGKTKTMLTDYSNFFDRLLRV